MSGYPHYSLYSSRQKHVSGAASGLYSSRRDRSKQDENDGDRARPSLIYPSSSGAYDRSALVDVTNKRHEVTVRPNKPLPDFPLAERGGPLKPLFGRKSLRLASLSSFSSIEINSRPDASVRSADGDATADKKGSKPFIDSEDSSPGKTKVPWSYFGYAEPKQITKVRREVLSRTVQPIDEPFEDQELDDYALPRRGKKSVQFLMGDDEDTQAGAEYENYLEETEPMQIGDEAEHTVLSESKKQVIERWLEYSSSTWDGTEQNSIPEPGTIEEDWALKEDWETEGSDTSAQLNKLALVSLDNLPIRRLNYVTATEMKTKWSSANPNPNKVRFVNKTTIIGHARSWEESNTFYHLSTSALQQARDLSRASRSVVPGLELLQQHLLNFSLTNDERQTTILSPREQLISRPLENHGPLSSISWDHEVEWKSHHYCKALKQLEGGGDILPEVW